ncbi:FimV/HubP family polar landmark protein, partial [Neisseria meningitidis]|uniref:FimV/HubP family polar landmark protein n=1 Tax=Neisseria meningitidis TaxID=487 RepID=UPI0023EA71B3
FLKVYETDAVAETAPETPDFNAAADDLSALLQPAEAPSVEENITETVAETPDFNATADDLSALLQPSEVPAVEENVTETVAETSDFHTAADDLSALLQPFETPAVEKFEAPAIEEKAAETVDKTPDFHTVADDLSALLQPAEVPAVEENAAEITLETPDSNTSEADALPDFLKDGEEETVDWSIYLSEENIPNNADTGFPSESVGSDAPSEAKYDLAEMYLEIGDRDAAAETVQKLLEEAEGDVLKRAQALAQELGI